MKARRVRGAVVLLLLLPGCFQFGGGEVPELTYYRIDTDPAVQTASAPVVSLTMRPFTESEALAREGIRYLTSATEGGYWSSHRWAEPVASMVGDAVRENLEGSGLFTGVVLLSNLGGADFVLDGEVHRFGERDRDDGWYAVAEITFELSRSRDGRLLYHRRFRVEERCGEMTVKALVEALGVSLSQILEALRADLSAACAKERP